MGGPGLPANEAGRRQHADAEQREDAWGGKARRLAVDHGEDQRAERGGADYRARDVDPPGARVRAFRQDQGRRRQRRKPERDVEPEDPAPAPRAHQGAAEQQHECERKAGHSG
jgi:hypothetical protein